MAATQCRCKSNSNQVRKALGASYKFSNLGESSLWTSTKSFTSITLDCKKRHAVETKLDVYGKLDVHTLYMLTNVLERF